MRGPIGPPGRSLKSRTRWPSTGSSLIGTPGRIGPEVCHTPGEPPKRILMAWAGEGPDQPGAIPSRRRSASSRMQRISSARATSMAMPGAGTAPGSS